VGFLERSVIVVSISEQFVMVDGSPALCQLAERTGYHRALCTRIQIRVVPDAAPDLSYLQQGCEDVPAAERRRYHAEDQRRLAAFGTTWEMIGIQAVGVVYVPQGPGVFQCLTISSAGCYGVESDSESTDWRSIGEEELANLRQTFALLHVHEPANQLVEWDAVFHHAVS